MIIVDKGRRKTHKAYRWIVLAGLMLILLLGFIFTVDDLLDNSPDSEFYLCSVENRQGHYLMGKGGIFGGGSTQSDEVAHTGKYSSKITPGWELQYGFSIRLYDLKPGNYYEANVWHYANYLDKAKLVVQGVGKSEFYQSADYPIERSTDNWERFQVVFRVPEDGIKYIHVYVVNNGQNISFFDDLSIQPIPIDPEEFQLPQIHLDLSPADYNFFEAQRTTAIHQGIISAAQKKWRKAHFRNTATGLPIPARVRLKGDLLDHLLADKWSFRIELDQSQNWNQLQTFSLQNPAARYYLDEWILHQFWQFNGVLTTHYDYAEFFLNNKSLGLYAIEEHFEPHLLETRGRRVGPILRFEESAFWEGVERQLQLNKFDYGGTHQNNRIVQTAEIEQFPNTGVDPALVQQATQLLRQFQYGNKAASEIFDLPLLAKFYAACDIFQAYHGLSWHNLRFYFNPSTQLLEPVGYDGCSYPSSTPLRILGQGSGHHISPLFEQLYQDKNFAAQYNQALFQLSSKTSLEAFLDKIRPQLIPRSAWIGNAFSEYKWREKKFLQRAQKIHATMLPYATNSLKAHRGGETQIQLTNWHSFPVKVVGFGTTKNKIDFPLADDVVLPPAGPREVLQRIEPDSPAHSISDLPFKWLSERAMAEQIIPSQTQIEYPAKADYVFFKTLGIDSVVYSPINNQSYSQQWTSSTRQNLILENPLIEKPYYEITGKQIKFLKGKHQIDELLVFPEDYQIWIAPGTVLDLKQNGGIICFGTIQALGNEENPISIQSTSSNQGLSLINSKGKNSFRYVHFTGIAPLSYETWQMTGAFSAYHSKIQLEHCHFTQTKGEDGVNLIRCEVDLQYCHFHKMPSDGLDLDFCKGFLSNCTFGNTGNDGLDVSGSLLDIRDCIFSGHQDKGISIGEKSDIALFNIEIKASSLGLAVKDLSTTIIDGIQMMDCPKGMAVYQKKGLYGGAHLIIKNLEESGIDQLYEVAPASSLEIDGVLLN